MMNKKLLDYLNVTPAIKPVVLNGEERIGFISKKTGVPQPWVLRNGELNQLIEFEDRVMSIYPSPDGSQILYVCDFGGNEKEQYFISDQNGKYLKELLVNPAFFHHFGGWSPDGEKIAFTSNRRGPGQFDGFILNIKTRETTQLFEWNSLCKIEGWLPDGKQIVVSKQNTNIDSHYEIYDIQESKWVEIEAMNLHSRNKSIQFSKDQTYAYYLSDSNRNTMALHRMKLTETDQPEELAGFNEWDIESFSLSPSGMKLIYIMNEKGYSKAYFYDVHMKKQQQLDLPTHGVIEEVKWINEKSFIYLFKSATEPGDIWKYSFDGLIVRLTHLGKDSHYEKEWQEPKLVSYQSFDQREIPYFLYGHSENSNKPALVYVHGGPESQIRPIYNPLIQYLVSEGYQVATPNVRGSMGYGRSYIQLDDVRKRMDAVADLDYLAKDLIDNQQINEAQIGIMGRSYGGFMVLAALTHYPQRWAAGVNIVGISHFTSFLENTGEWRRHLRECEYGSLSQDKEFFDRIAPLNHVDKIEAPLLIIHGRNDTRVPVSEAIQLHEKMQHLQKISELIIFENEGHQTEKIENHITLNEKSLLFFNKYVKK